MSHGNKGRARVLYFVNGTTPSEEQIKDAEQFGHGCSFRNAKVVSDGDPLEHADIVAGEVPPVYRAAYQNPSQYANAFSRGAPVAAVALTQPQTDAVAAERAAADAEAIKKADAAREQAAKDAIQRGADKAARQSADPASPAPGAPTGAQTPGTEAPAQGWGVPAKS
jgi:hypothetical protein